MEINGKTFVTGLIGYPIKESLSPRMHNSAFKYLNLNFVYIPFSIPHNNLKMFLTTLKMIENIKGVNVTVPYKQKVIKYLDNIDKLSLLSNAINTIVFKNGKAFGYNTDIYGFLESLKSVFQLKGEKAFLLGAGGVGSAIACSIAKEKIKEISVYDMNKKRMYILVDRIRKNFNNIKIKMVSEKNIKEEIKTSSIFINATPIGMNKDDPLVVDISYLNKPIFIFDVVYQRETELIKFAKRKNFPHLDGKLMLLYQGARAFSLWTGKEAPIGIMKKALQI